MSFTKAMRYLAMAQSSVAGGSLIAAMHELGDLHEEEFKESVEEYHNATYSYEYAHPEEECEPTSTREELASIEQEIGEAFIEIGLLCWLSRAITKSDAHPVRLRALSTLGLRELSTSLRLHRLSTSRLRSFCWASRKSYRLSQNSPFASRTPVARMQTAVSTRHVQGSPCGTCSKPFSSFTTPTSPGVTPKL